MIDNDGVRLAMSCEGQGPDLLFVHGLGSAQVLWHQFVSELADRFRCWNLDLRGHGNSDRAVGGYGRASYASDVVAALDHIASPTIAIGHSLGGVSIARVGPTHHQYLRAGYLVDAPTFPSASGRPVTATIFERQLAMLREFQPQNRPVDDYEAVLGDAPYIGGGTNRDAMIPQQLRGRAESLSQLDPACIETILTGTDDSPPVEPAMSVPLRALAADPELGAAFRPEFADRLQAATPHAEVATLTGVGHQMMMIRDYDSVVLADLTAFIERILEND